MRDLEALLGLTVLAVTTLMIVRWRGRGVLASILFGWGAIYLINISFPRDKWVGIEFAEDWAPLGWFLMSMWSLLVYWIVWLIRFATSKARSSQAN